MHVLGLLAADFEVSELGIRQQPAVDEQRAADPGPERQQHDDAFAIAARTKGHLGHAGASASLRTRRAPDPRLEQGRGIRSDPAPVDIRRRVGDPRLVTDGKANPTGVTRQAPGNRGQQVDDRLGVVPGGVGSRSSSRTTCPLCTSTSPA